MPQLLADGSPSPRKLSDASSRMAMFAARTSCGMTERRDGRRQVAGDQVAGARAHRARRRDVASLAQRQHLRSDLAGGARPDHGADDDDLGEETRPDVDAEHDHQRQERERQQHVHAAHQHGVRDPPEETGQQSDRGPDEGGHHGGRHADQERHAGAVDQFAQQVLSDIVGPERMGHRRRGEGRGHVKPGMVRSEQRRQQGRAGDNREERDTHQPDDVAVGAGPTDPAGGGRVAGRERCRSGRPRADSRIQQRIGQVGDQVRGDHANRHQQECPWSSG